MKVHFPADPQSPFYERGPLQGDTAVTRPAAAHTAGLAFRASGTTVSSICSKPEDPWAGGSPQTLPTSHSPAATALLSSAPVPCPNLSSSCAPDTALYSFIQQAFVKFPGGARKQQRVNLSHFLMVSCRNNRQKTNSQKLGVPESQVPPVPPQKWVLKSLYVDTESE